MNLLPRLHTLVALAFAATFFTPVTPVQAENWPNWRGPNFDGSSPAVGLPTTFSKTENVRWMIDLPGDAASTPVIWEDRVFMTTTNLETRVLEAVALNRFTGEELWRIECGIGYQQDERSNFASPSPATDGELVVFFFGTGDMVATDLNGKELWRRNIQRDYGEFAFLWTFSASPLLYEGKLYLPILQRDVAVSGRGAPEGNESFLLGLDPKTGEEIFKVERDSDSVAESRESFATATPYTWEGRTDIIVAGADILTGHNPETGAEIWRTASWNPDRITHWRLVPCATAGDGIIIIPAPKKEPVYAFKAGGEGLLGAEHTAWVSDGNQVSSDVSTPLFYDGRFYVLDSDRKALACVDPQTGDVIWRGELPARAKLEASPTGADGKIYMISHHAEVYVVKAGGDEFELLHEVDLRERGDTTVRSTIAAAHDAIYIRTHNRLYCFANNAVAAAE